jgi:arabinogalactan endo-1,4-beta-galactosidase
MRTKECLRRDIELVGKAVVVVVWVALAIGGSAGAGDFIRGADVSYLQQIEDSGGIYIDGGVAGDALDILADHGLNYIRLRLWHTPAGGYNDLEHTLAMASRVKAKGLGMLLDFHFSDGWADPGKQSKPRAWSDLPFAALKDSVYTYTRHAITQLKNQNTLPDMVQIGNEITCGILWDDGRICSRFDTPGQWHDLTLLMGEAIRGVDDSLGPEDTVRIMVHIDRGGDNGGCRWFYDKLLAQGVEFDVIGLSFYPWWHGTLADLSRNLSDLAARYGKDLVVVETAYPWTLKWCDDVHNSVGLPGQLHPGYTASVDGQRGFLLALMDTVRSVPDRRGLGIFYWSPEYISVRAVGSSWENLALFDFEGNLLHSIAAFDSGFTRVRRDR